MRHKFKVISLDVWGHGPDEHDKYDCDGECDGYTVNDAHYCGAIEVEAEERAFNVGGPREFREWIASDENIVRALVDGGYLTSDCTADVLEIDGEYEYTMYVNRKSDGKPLLHIEHVK